MQEGSRKAILAAFFANLGIAIAKFVGFLLTRSETQHVKPTTQSYWKFIRAAKQPELPVVLLEDTGAMVGLVLALGGVMTAHFTHNPRWDAAGSISIGVLLVVIAAVLAIEMKGLLIGEGASADQDALIRSSLGGAPHVTKLIHLRTEHLGPDELLVTAKLEFDRSLSVEGLADAIDGAEAALRARVPIARLVYLEPDIARS